MKNIRKQTKKNYPYQRYKKIRGEQALRTLFGECDENGTYIPWRYIVWSCKYGFAQSKFTRMDGRGIVSFIDDEYFEKYVKPWVCMTRAQRKMIRQSCPAFCTIVKKAMRIAKLEYSYYLAKKYNYYREYV